MLHRTPTRRFLAVWIGLAAGFFSSRLWPNTPLYAVSTDRVDTYGIATGLLDANVEAVYLLDFLTGDLRAVVLGRDALLTGGWTGFFDINVAADLDIDPQKNPKFMLVTGQLNLQRKGGSRAQPNAAAVYVAEVTTGKIAAYVVPWMPSLYAASQMQSGRIVRVGVTMFRVPLGSVPNEVPAGRRR